MEKIYDGFQIDRKQCIKKLVSRQLGEPLTLFNQIIDNLLDEYIIRNYEITNRILIINFLSDSVVTLANKCTGFREEELKALTTIGGTTKSNSPEPLYGIHGIGILSAVNPDFVEKFFITFYYIPDQMYMRIDFFWEEENLFYKIGKADINEYPFTCEFAVQMRDNSYVSRIEYIINQQLKYIPSPSFINGIRVQNEFMNALFERSDSTHHIVIKPKYLGCISYSILYNYKYITGIYDTATFLHGGHNKTTSLEEYTDGYFYSRAPFMYPRILFPYIRNVNIICNSGNLSLTMSKEGFYLDYNYHSLQQFLRLALFEYLSNNFRQIENEVLLNNIYIFKKQIKEFLANQNKTEDNDFEKLFLSKLAETKFLRIFNSPEIYSMKEILSMLKDSDKPLFYSLEGNNLNFAQGRFSHDFILTLSREFLHLESPDFFEKIFKEIFADVINLDKIFDNPGIIGKLIERGIVNREDVYPRVRFRAFRDLTGEEIKFIKETEAFFNRRPIRKIIEHVLLIRIRTVRIGLYNVINGDQLVLNASFFDRNGNFLLDDRESNIRKVENNPAEKTWVYSPDKNLDLFIGLNTDSVELKYVIRNSMLQPIEYSLMAICNQLVATQKFISTDSSFYYRMKHYLLDEIWTYLLENK